MVQIISKLRQLHATRTMQSSYTSHLGKYLNWICSFFKLPKWHKVSKPEIFKQGAQAPWGTVRAFQTCHSMLALLGVTLDSQDQPNNVK